MVENRTPVHERRTNNWGIDLNYEDAFGKWHETPPETIGAILAARGAKERELAPLPDNSVIVAHVGEQRKLPANATIVLETGETVSAMSRLSADLPAGYHQLQFEGSDRPIRLIVTPSQCWLPKDLRTWGWALQLYSARARDSWGIGDFADLERLAEWSSSSLGAGVLLVNPLSAATPVLPQQASPYFPSSRRFLNPLWIHVHWVPGATAGRIPQLEGLARAGRELNSERFIQRDKIFNLKMQALELLWREFPGDAAFDRFRREGGSDLNTFATFCALAERHRSGWHEWPAAYRHPDDGAVAEFAKQNGDRIRFHQWLQWLLDTQLARSSRHLALMRDLPIGVDPDGADAWAWQDVLAKGIAVGSPPDEFNTQGQNWGLPPFIPHKLRAARYEPFIQTIRSAFRHGGGIRIDHVMGLFRLFWIPQGLPSVEGTYVRYDADDLLGILALESQRAHAYVVGEDLGTVEEGMREELAGRRILSYRLLWFEKDDPERYPKEALAAVTTHDLPTVTGLWTGVDLAKQQELDLNPNAESTERIRDRLISMAALEPDASKTEVVASAYRLLAKAPSRILAACFDDAALAEERPNMPATTSGQNPNWSLALPRPIEELMSAELPARIAAELRREEKPI
jgi:4-alpha-glucanotransferase